MLLIMCFTIKSPILISSEFIYTASLQISNRRFLLFLLCILSFFWAFRCIRFLRQQNSKQRIMTFITRLILFLIIFFFSSETFMLYIMFELSVIPIFTIIIGWGYQRERIEASLRLIFYTITASLPLLGSFIYIFLFTLSNKLIYYDFWISVNNSNIMKLLIFVFFSDGIQCHYWHSFLIRFLFPFEFGSDQNLFSRMIYFPNINFICLAQAHF